MSERPPVCRRSFPAWLIPALILLMVPVLVITALAAAVITSFGLGGDARTLRNAALAAPGAEWQRTFEFKLGAIPVALARTGLLFVDLEREARLGLRAFRGGQVGIYQLRSGRTDLRALLQDVDREMKDRELDLLVRVVDGNDAVAVYLSGETSSERDLEATFLVLSDDQMIVASVRGNLEPLLEIVKTHAPKELFSRR